MQALLASCCAAGSAKNHISQPVWHTHCRLGCELSFPGHLASGFDASPKAADCVDGCMLPLFDAVDSAGCEAQCADRARHNGCTEHVWAGNHILCGNKTAWCATGCRRGIELRSHWSQADRLDDNPRAGDELRPSTRAPTRAPTVAPTRVPTPRAPSARFSGGFAYEADVLTTAVPTRAPTKAPTPPTPSPESPTPAPTPPAAPTPSPTPAPLFCPAGKFGQIDEGACNPCESGRYAASAGKRITCERCPPGKFQMFSGGNDCSQCPAGTSSPDPAAIECTKCAPGQFSGGLGSRSCRACWAGRFCSMVGTNLTGAVCPPGKYAGAAAPSCKVCPAGRFSKQAQAECELCFASHFGTSEGAANGGCDGRCAPGRFSKPDRLGCKDCKEGRHSASGSAGDLCDGLCPMGRYSGQGSAKCTTCQAGRSQGFPGESACTSCKVGRFATGGNRVCSTCPAGKQNTEHGEVQCHDCAPGRYGAAPNACAGCGAGRYGKGGSPSEKCSGACPAGRFSRAGAATCIVCNAGQWSARRSVRCELCVEGRYGNGADVSASCAGPCQAGRFSPKAGSPHCDMCVAGRYSFTASTRCLMCAPGRYSTAVGASGRCALCASGLYSSPNGAECLPCTAGHFGGSTHTGSPACEGPCPAGRYSNAGWGKCKRCSPGRAQPGNGASSCAVCAEGTFAPLSGHTRCLACRKGLWSIVGASKCQVVGHLGVLAEGQTGSPTPAPTAVPTPVPTPHGPCTAVALISADRPLMNCGGAYVQLDKSQRMYTYEGANRCGSGKAAYMYYARQLRRWVVGASILHGPYLLASEVTAFTRTHIPKQWSVRRGHLFHIDTGISARCVAPPPTPAPTPVRPTPAPTPEHTEPSELLRFHAHIYEIPEGKSITAIAQMLQHAIAAAAGVKDEAVTVGDAHKAAPPPSSAYLAVRPEPGIAYSVSIRVVRGFLTTQDVVEANFADGVVKALRISGVDIESIVLRKMAAAILPQSAPPRAARRQRKTMAQLIAAAERQDLAKAQTAKAWEHVGRAASHAGTGRRSSASKGTRTGSTLRRREPLVPVAIAVASLGAALLFMKLRGSGPDSNGAATGDASAVSPEELTQLAASVQAQRNAVDYDVEDI